MQRRGFIFGAGAALAVIAAPKLMRVSSRLLMPAKPAIIDPGHSHFVKLFSDPVYAPPMPGTRIVSFYGEPFAGKSLLLEDYLNLISQAFPPAEGA